MQSQFLMRLELESTCSSWIGIRKLLSERQIIKQILYRVEGAGKGNVSGFMDDTYEWHWVSACLPSQCQETPSIGNSENRLYHCRVNGTWGSCGLTQEPCVCRRHFKTIHFYVSKKVHNILFKRWFWIFFAPSQNPHTKSLYHFCRD